VSQSEIENNEFKKKLSPLSLTIKEIQPDGNCLYNSIADQLRIKGENIDKDYYKTLRGITAKYMLEHPDDFMVFIDSEDGIISEELFKDYCSKVANTNAWGGQLELKAITHCLRIPITIFTSDINSPNIEMGKEYDGVSPLRISYHRYSFALGEHYNSIVAENKET